MKRARNLVSGATLLTVALVVGVVTALAAFGWANGLRGERTTEGPQVSAVFARDDIPAGTKLAETLLEVRQIPQEDALLGTVATPDLAVGRTLRYPLNGGEQVTESKLVATSVTEGEGLAFSVPPGYRALSVAVNEVSGAGGLIVPGDRVDIMVATTQDKLVGPGGGAPSPAAAADASKPVVLTVLQDMLVLAVGQMITEPLDPGRDPATLRPGNAAAQPAARTVTFAVQPAQAQALFMASNQGTLGLALRGFGDGSQQSLEPAVRVEPAGSGTIRQVSR